MAAEEEGKERIRQKKIWSLTQWTAAGTSHTSSWQRSSSAERTMNYPYYLSCFRWHSIYSVSQKKSPPYGFLKFFPKRLEIFNQFLPARRYASAGYRDRSVSVCLSVRRRYCVKTKKASGMISSPSDSPKTLVFWRQISSPNSKGFPPNGGLKQGSVVLNMLTEFDVTISLGSLFHSSITLWLKKFGRTCRLDRDLIVSCNVYTVWVRAPSNKKRNFRIQFLENFTTISGHFCRFHEAQDT